MHNRKHSLAVFFLCFILLLSMNSCLRKSENIQSGGRNINKQLSSDSFRHFTENKGQWDSSIKFIGSTDFGQIAIAEDGVYYHLLKSENQPQTSYDNVNDLTSDLPVNAQSHVIKLSFVNPESLTLKGLERLPYVSNFFIGNKTDKWTTGCRNYTKITYQNVWKGIDLSYFFNEKGIKSEYYVKPGANIQNLQLKVEGAEIIVFDTKLELKTPIGSIIDDQLKSYQQNSFSNIQSKFITNDNIQSFSIENYNNKEPIVIDPIIYSTFLGGGNGAIPPYDQAWDIATDSQGNSYISGTTRSWDFPIQTNIQTVLKGNQDIVIVKLNPLGKMVYSTYLGSSDQGGSTSFLDDKPSIAVDSIGAVYITGKTYGNDFPTINAFQPTTPNDALYDSDAFITKIASSGSSLIYSSYLGGSNNDEAGSICVDFSNNAYVVGSTYSTDFPLKNSIKSILSEYNSDIFITKIVCPVTALKQNTIKKPVFTRVQPQAGIVFSTYFGGTNYDYGSSIAVDQNSNIYIAGNTKSQDFPMKNAFQTKINGDPTDGFVSKININGNVIVFSTLFGGNGPDKINSLSVDKTGSYIYITGDTPSNIFPLKNPVQNVFSGERDSFVSRFDINGGLIFSTLISTGYGKSYGDDIIIDQNNNGYSCGSIKDRVLTMKNPIQALNKGFADAYVIKWSPEGTILFSTYLGGTNYDWAKGISKDPSGNIILFGDTLSNDFPIINEIQSICKGSNFFITKFSTP